MHICPHCQKLGISTYAAIGDPFSRGLATCRYCTNVSKARRNLVSPFIMPALLALFATLIYFWRPPVEFGMLWLCMLGFIGLVLADRITEFDKYQPPTKDGDLARTAVARSEDGTARVSLLLLLLALAVPMASFAAEQSLRQALDLRDVEARASPPAFIGRHIHGKCGDLDVFDRHITGNMLGHAVSIQKEDGVLVATVDGAHTTTGFTDASGRIVQIVDEHGNTKTPLKLTPEQARAEVARSRADLEKLLDDCAPVAAAPTTKCLDVDNFAAPAPGTESGDGTGVSGTASRKSCLPDGETSEDFWINYFEIDGLFDMITRDELLACLQKKMACQAGCNDGLPGAGLICTVGAAVAGPRAGPVVAVACGGAAYWMWSNCLSGCAARYPDC